MLFPSLKTNGAPIALLAGKGELPLILAQAAASLKKKFILVGIDGLTDRKIESYATETHYLAFGTLGRLPEILKSAGVRHAVMAGGIPKKEIYNPAVRLDDAVRSLLTNTRNKGDDHLLRAFSLFLKIRCGVNVIDPRILLKDALAPKGVLTRRAPSSAEWDDFKFGWKIAKGIGKMDIGQTVAVKNGVVVAVEALEGTDQAIRRAGSVAESGAVIVKVAKPNQDLRFDLPSVGAETLVSMKSASCFFLGVEHRKTIILHKEQFIQEADRQNICVVGL